VSRLFDLSQQQRFLQNLNRYTSQLRSHHALVVPIIFNYHLLMGSGRMCYDENEIAETLQRLVAQQRFLVDASTLIVLDKAGLLQPLVHQLPCETILEVVHEVGEKLIARAGIRVRPAHLPLSPPSRSETDSLLFFTAQAERLALVSEDKKLLRRCDAAEVPYYNAAMLCMRLRMRAEDGFDIAAAYRRLLEAARYGQQVGDYLQALDLYLLKQGR